MKGTFAAVKFHQDTRKALLDFARENNVPNIIDERDLHCSVIYSKTEIEGLRARRSIDPPIYGITNEFDVFNTSDGKRCLVLKFSSGDLHMRHNFLKDWKGADHSFPAYIPHITLSYDIGDFDISSLPDIRPLLPRIVIVEEYSEELHE